MIEALPGIVYLFDERRRMLRWNRNLARASDRGEEQMAQLDPLDLFEADERERVHRRFLDVLETGEAAFEALLVSREERPRPYYLSNTRIEFGGSRCVLGFGIDISVRRAAEEDLARHALRLQSAARQLMTSQEAERHRLARDLHDSVGQDLAAISLNCSILADALPAEWPAALRQRWASTQELLEQTARHVREVMIELRPPGLDELGFVAVLEEHAVQAADRAGIEPLVDGDELEPPLDPADAIALFRISQEAIKNVLRHARASRLQVRVEQGDDRVTLTIEDDGQGFDLRGQRLAGAGLGIATMHERALGIGAALRVHSQPGHGTRVVVEMPHARR